MRSASCGAPTHTPCTSHATTVTSRSVQHSPTRASPGPTSNGSGACPISPSSLKGVIRPENAVLARQHGASAVIVSNHAGQGLRSSAPVAHSLPAIVDAVAGDLEVYADSGIRSGRDVLRALALGARAVLIGRPTIWGLAVGGAHGVERVFGILRAELSEAMALTGASRITDIERSVLSPRSIQGLT